MISLKNKVEIHETKSTGDVKPADAMEVDDEASNRFNI